MIRIEELKRRKEQCKGNKDCDKCQARSLCQQVNSMLGMIDMLGLTEDLEQFINEDNEDNEDNNNGTIARESNFTVTVTEVSGGQSVQVEGSGSRKHLQLAALSIIQDLPEELRHETIMRLISVGR